MVWRKAWTVIGLAAWLAGCSSAPLSSYDLTALSGGGAARAPRGVLLISEPLAVQALDSERILVRTDGNGLAYLAGAQWAARLPALVQSRLVESFENSHMLRSVAGSGARVVSDAHLEAEIRSFEFDATAGEAVVSLSVKLINDRNGKVIKAQVFSAHLPQSSSDGAAVSKTLDATLAQVMRQIIGWVGGAV